MYRIEEASIDSVITILKKQFPCSSGFEYKIISVDEIYPSALHVYRKRLEHAVSMYKLCQKNGIPLGAPYTEIYDDLSQHLVVPPIIELREGKHLLCDGMHRIFVFRQFGIKEVFCIVINNTTLPLAGDINSWENVTVELNQLSVEKNFINYNPVGLTGYSHFCNSDFFWRK